MTVALAQAEVSSTTITSSVITATLGSAPTAGNIIVAVVGASTAAANVSMSQPGSAWTIVEQSVESGQTLSIFARLVGVGESATYKANVSAAGAGFLAVFEISGANSTVAAAVPTANHGQNQTASSVTALLATSAALTPTAGLSVYAIAGIWWTTGVTASSLAATGGFTATQVSTRGGYAKQAIASTSGNYDPQFSWTTAKPCASAMVIVQSGGAAGAADFLAMF